MVAHDHGADAAFRRQAFHRQRRFWRPVRDIRRTPARLRRRLARHSRGRGGRQRSQHIAARIRASIDRRIDGRVSPRSGLVAGFVWHGRLMAQDRWSYRYGPVVGGLALLMFTGTGGPEHRRRCTPVRLRQRIPQRHAARRAGPGTDGAARTDGRGQPCAANGRQQLDCCSLRLTSSPVPVEFGAGTHCRISFCNLKKQSKRPARIE